jgi:Na+-translocating ferredoxin:NAD+ oxidoreductase RnfG subunit
MKELKQIMKYLLPTGIILGMISLVSMLLFGLLSVFVGDIVAAVVLFAALTAGIAVLSADWDEKESPKKIREILEFIFPEELQGKIIRAWMTITMVSLLFSIWFSYFNEVLPADFLEDSFLSFIATGLCYTGWLMFDYHTDRCEKNKEEDHE